MRVLRGWLCGLWLAMSVLAVVALAGCQRSLYHDDRALSAPDPGDEPPVTDPATCECTPVAPFGFFGPSIVGWGPTWQSIQCPEDATLPGFRGLVLSPPQWARECLITPLTTCSESGWVCAPPRPVGFDYCIYRGEDFTCPADYPHPQSALEADGGMLVMDHTVTLCCVGHDPGG